MSCKLSRELVLSIQLQRHCLETNVDNMLAVGIINNEAAFDAKQVRCC